MSFEAVVSGLVGLLIGLMVGNHPLSLLGTNAQDAAAIMGQHDTE